MQIFGIQYQIAKKFLKIETNKLTENIFWIYSCSSMVFLIGVQIFKNIENIQIDSLCLKNTLA